MFTMHNPVKKCYAFILDLGSERRLAGLLNLPLHFNKPAPGGGGGIYRQVPPVISLGFITRITVRMH